MIIRVLLTVLLAAPAFAAEHAAADAHGDEHEQTLATVIMHHITNAPLENQLAQEWGVSKAVFMMFCASALLIAMFGFAMRRSRLSGAPSGMTNALEAVVVYIRDEVAIAGMGEKWGKRFTPFLCTLFFFILACNLLGMVPGSYTATSNLNVTATLALVTFGMMIISGIMVQGPLGYLKHMAGPPGTPLAIVPLVFLIEFLSLFVKPIALTIRLGANMTAGHIVILVMLSFIFVFNSVLMGVFSVPLAVAITILEIIVAFIQAYVFTLLSSIFIGMGLHASH